MRPQVDVPSFSTRCRRRSGVRVLVLLLIGSVRAMARDDLDVSHRGFYRIVT